jgi:hypothetical protein
MCLVSNHCSSICRHSRGQALRSRGNCCVTLF